MSDSVIFDSDLPSRSVSIWHWDNVEEKAIIEDRQDVEPIVDMLKAFGPERTRTRQRNEHQRHVASIPMNIFQDLQNKWKAMGLSSVEKQQAMKAFLNGEGKVWKYDPSFRA